jgi:outer membrane protein assembly factor BamB
MVLPKYIRHALLDHIVAPRPRFVQSPTQYVSSCEPSNRTNRLTAVSSPAEVTSSQEGAGRRRPGVAVALTVAIASLVLLSAFAGRPAGIVETAATRFAPADGYRLRYTSVSGTMTGDWAVDRASALLNQGPKQLYSWLGVTKLDWATAVLARLSAVRADASGVVRDRSDDFYSISADGIRAEVTIAADGTTQMFVPGRLDLSAAPRQQAWTSSGLMAVLPPGGKPVVHSYRTDYVSAAATGAGLDGCIVVTASQQLDEQQPTTFANTWCPGRGVTSFTHAGTTWTANTDQAAAAPGAVSGFDWSTADRLTFAQRRVNNPGDNLILGLSQTPASLPDGTAVAIQSTTDDLVAIDTSAAVPPSRWRSRPGGRPTSLTSLGAVTVVATTDRELVAYGPDGDWRWHAQLSDLTVVPPVRLGDVVAVAGLDGSVSAYDVTTGAERWRTQVGIEIRAPMVVSGDRLVAIDQLGELTCLDATGAQKWSTQANAAELIAVTTGPSPVVVVPGASVERINAYSLADGSDAWQVRTPMTARSLIGLDGQVVVRDGNRTVSLDAATGGTRWTWDAERTYGGAGGGDRVLLLTGGRLVLLDSAGRQVRDWTVAIGDIDPDNTWLSTSAGHVLLFGQTGMMLGVSR